MDESAASDSVKEEHPPASAGLPRGGLLTRLVSASGLRLVKRIIIGVIGGTVTLVGVALLVLPGPAFIVIPVGLAILATEFVWAKRWLRRGREMVARAQQKQPPSA